MRVVVTGAAGFIGSHLSRALVEAGHDVIGVDAFLGHLYPPAQKRANVTELLTGLGGFQLVEGDLREIDLFPILDGADALINEAAMPGLALSWSEVELYLSCNVTALSRILACAREVALPRLIQISTSSVYGSMAAGNETLPTKPTSPYGISKLAAENLVGAYQEAFGLPAMILRYFSVYGPRQRPDMAYSIFAEALIDGRVVTVFGDGNQSRSNTYIDDCVGATIDALDGFADGGVFNIAGGRAITVLDAIEVIARTVRVEPRLEFVATLPGDQRDTAGDWTAANRAFGYHPSTDPDVGLERQALWHMSRHENRAGRDAAT